MNPLVSVIIPTFAGEDTILQTVKSVLNQTYNNIEIIVVDDNGLGSEHQLKTFDALKSVIEQQRVSYLTHKKNINGSAARNTGVNAAHGEFVALLDDDDVYLPDNIANQVPVLQSSSCEVALTYCSNVIYLNDKKVGEMHALQSGDVLYPYLAHKIEISTCSFIIRRKVYLEIGGFDESFKRHQDWEFMTRVLDKYKVIAIDKYGYRRNITLRNNAKNPKQYELHRQYFLDKMKYIINTMERNQQNHIYAINYFDIALQYFKFKNYSSFWLFLNKISPKYLILELIFERLKIYIRRGKVKIC